MERTAGDMRAVKYAVMSILVFVAVAIVFAYISYVRAQHELWLGRTNCSPGGVYAEAGVATMAREKACA
ncbi:MAG TPA: hypothetical protein VLB29_10290 [Nocardioidaceae bacterium]|nr:hypothetical protein [Nocardioidaceae bacterium]